MSSTTNQTQEQIVQKRIEVKNGSDGALLQAIQQLININNSHQVRAISLEFASSEGDPSSPAPRTNFDFTRSEQEEEQEELKNQSSNNIASSGTADLGTNSASTPDEDITNDSASVSPSSSKVRAK